MPENNTPVLSRLAKVKADLREITGRTRGPYHNEHWEMMETLAHALHLISAQNNPQHYDELKAEVAVAKQVAADKADYVKAQKVAGNKPDNLETFQKDADAAAAYAADLEAQLGKAGA